MYRRSVLMSIALLLALPAVAGAQQYPPSSADLTVSDSTPGVGQQISVAGSGFAPGANVVITFESTPVTLATVAADAGGAFSTVVTIPSNATPGVHTIKATGAGAGGGTLVLSAQVTVGGASGGSLAKTGADNIFPLLLVAAGLVLVGGVLIVSVRRRGTPRA